MTIVKANALADIDGNEVYVVVTDNKEGPIVQQLSHRVHLIDLDINYYYRDTERPRLLNHLVVRYKNRAHYRALEKVLKDISPDVVISVGTSEKYMLPAMKHRSWKIIREFHHVFRNYRSQNARNLFDSLMAPIMDFYELKIKEKKYDRIVVLTQEDKMTNWEKWDNVVVMPNPVSFKSTSVSALSEKRVVAFGRLDPIKNFASLIRAFKLVATQHPDWTLNIYGNGPLKGQLQDTIDTLNLTENVSLMGFTDNVPGELLHSSICALSSLTEGFSLVLVEAMECGVPVVSYQCPCGPQDIITDAEDGFLVPVGDESLMAERICDLIENESLRSRMGAAARATAQHYSVESITERWMDLFSSLVHS